VPTVNIVRFGTDVSVPVTQHGSSFRIGPLTGDDSRVRVQLMYLPAGGRIGRHDTAARQLLAVVAGEGWGSGAGGARRDLRAGYGALWEPGEPHEAGTGTGLTAVCVEGEFDVWALRVTQELTVSDYDSRWPDWFEQIRATVWPAVGDVVLRIDHVGSTSVPGLAAKPIIDLDIVVADEAGVGPVIERLAGIGYRWRGDLGISGRQAFEPPPGSVLPPHHLYLVTRDSKAHLDHWLLRDLLRADPQARARYAALKRRNAETADGDIDVYVQAKADFVTELLARARRERGLPPAP
jgi:GrpB-like predicted nucleotidyltransferase (UPF0157 family)/quercetin dioxygenase-like cupin family protein